MVTQLHNLKNIFITSRPDFRAISLDCQVVERLTRALFPLLQRPGYLLALPREWPSGLVPGPFGDGGRAEKSRSPGLSVLAKPAGVHTWPAACSPLESRPGGSVCLEPCTSAHSF